MPLEAPADPHTTQSNVTVPDWATTTQASAEFVWLNKATTKRTHISVNLGNATDMGEWQIYMLGVATGLRIKNNAFFNDENIDNPAALIELRHNNKLAYRGWIYQNFPELFGLEDKDLKVWLKAIRLRAAADSSS
ncbi:MAG: DUF2155 domain-containing protein [Mariprofundus sp.]|nr:DUF2155 domain-containing protein [Mariprofundus sp.]